jgi:Fe-S oxidoreductase
MAALKAEAMYHYYREKGFDMRTKFFGKFDAYASWASIFPGLTNALLKNTWFERTLKKQLGIAYDRSLPQFNGKRGSRILNPSGNKEPELVLYIDEFSEYQDGEVVSAAVELLNALGYSFSMVYSPSGRAAFSKSMLHHAEKSAEKVLDGLKPYLEKDLPIVGLEPSAVLGFRDEYLKLRLNRQDEIRKLSKISFTIEEFLFGEMEKGKLSSDSFHKERAEVHIHLHCHQKALSHLKYSKATLSLPENYKVRLIPSGCCGMAGSFGYEEEHYEVSKEIGELVLIPHIRKNTQAIIAAAGTSCRHQIKEGTGKRALHPAEILRNALK